MAVPIWALLSAIVVLTLPSSQTCATPSPSVVLWGWARFRARRPWAGPDFCFASDFQKERVLDFGARTAAPLMEGSVRVSLTPLGNADLAPPV